MIKLPLGFDAMWPCVHGTVRPMDPIPITYQRRYGDVWAVFLSTGDELTVKAGHDEAGLTEARASAQRHIGDAAIAVERVDTTTGSIEWRGLRFEPLSTT